jgi:hypothetical protein
MHLGIAAEPLLHPPFTAINPTGMMAPYWIGSLKIEEVD